MSLGAAQQYLDKFLSDIRPVEDAYQDELFSYLAVKSGDDFVLIQGTLYFNVMPPTVPLGSFASENVKAGHFKISELGLSSKNFINEITKGSVPIPGSKLKFPGNGDPQHYGANYFPFHEIGLPQRHITVLWIFGAQSNDFLPAKQPGLDWEVRAASTPYDGVAELLTYFQPGVLQGVNRIDLAAMEVAAIESSSLVEGEEARLVIKTAAKAAPERLAIGIRVSSENKVIKRTRIVGTDFAWTTDSNGMRVGRYQFAVPRASIVQGIASYNGIAQHYYFFGDPKSFQNPRRAAYEAFDPKLETMTDIIAKAQGRGSEAKDFEAVIPWLFWMQGFAPAYVGGPPRMRDAADFLASTPSGHIAVVECTTGLLKDDSKLQKLYDRAEAVRRNLDASSTRYVKVLPVIITSKTSEAIRPDMEQAEKLGIYVIAREDLDQLLPRTLFPQNADQMFEQAEQAVQDAKAKHLGTLL